MFSNVVGLLLLGIIITSALPDHYNEEEAGRVEGAEGSGVARPPVGSGVGSSEVESDRPQAKPPPPPQQQLQSQQQPTAQGFVASASPQVPSATARLSRPNGASIAQEAALEARAASDAQLVAGQQAAHQVKAQLAERAQQAAQAAQAALVGKQQMVEQLEEEVREAQAVVQEEGASLAQAQQSVQAAAASAQQAQQQLKVLTSAVQLEQANVGNAEQAATGAQQELTEKMQLVDAARRRVQMLLSQLAGARADFVSTRQAADKAMAAAHEAKVNAARNRRDGNEWTVEHAHREVRREALDVQIAPPGHRPTTPTPSDIDKAQASSSSVTEGSSEGHSDSHPASESVQDATPKTSTAQSGTSTLEKNTSSMVTSNNETQVKTGIVATSTNDTSDRNVRDIDATTRIRNQEGYSSSAMTTGTTLTGLPGTTAEVTGSNGSTKYTTAEGSASTRTVASTVHNTSDITKKISSLGTTKKGGDGRNRRDLSPVRLRGFDSSIFATSEIVPTEIEQREILKNAVNRKEYVNEDALEKEPLDNTYVSHGTDTESDYTDQSAADKTLVEENRARVIRLTNGIDDNPSTPSKNLKTDGNNSERKEKRQEASIPQNEDESENIEQRYEEMPATVNDNAIEQRSNREISELETPIPLQEEDIQLSENINDLERSGREVNIPESQTTFADQTQEYLTKDNPTKKPQEDKDISIDTQFTQTNPESMNVINSDTNVNQDLARVEDDQNVIPLGINEAETVEIEAPKKSVATYETDPQERLKRKDTELRVDSTSNPEINKDSAESAVCQKRFDEYSGETDNIEKNKEKDSNEKSNLIGEGHSSPSSQLKRSVSEDYETSNYYGNKRQNRQSSPYKGGDGEEISAVQSNVDEEHQTEVQHAQTDQLDTEIDSEHEKKQKRHLENVFYVQTSGHADLSNTEEEMKGERLRRDVVDKTEHERRSVNTGDVEESGADETRPKEIGELGATESSARDIKLSESKRESQELRHSVKKKRDVMLEEQEKQRQDIEPHKVNSISIQYDTRQLTKEGEVKRDLRDFQSGISSKLNYESQEDRRAERRKRETLGSNSVHVFVKKHKVEHNEERNRKRRKISQFKTERTSVGSDLAEKLKTKGRRKLYNTISDNSHILDYENTADKSTKYYSKFPELRRQNKEVDHTEATLVRRTRQENSKVSEIKRNTNEIIPTYNRYRKENAFKSEDDSCSRSPKISGSLRKSKREGGDTYSQNLNSVNEAVTVGLAINRLTKDEECQSNSPLSNKGITNKVLVGDNQLGVTHILDNVDHTRVMNRRVVSNVPFYFVTWNDMGLRTPNTHCKDPDNTRRRRRSMESDISKHGHMNSLLSANGPTCIKASVRGTEERPRRGARQWWDKLAAAVRMPERLRKSLSFTPGDEDSAGGTAATARPPITWAEAG